MNDIVLLDISQKKSDIKMSCGEVTYVVQPGDSLVGISLKFDMSVNLLKKLNHLFGKSDLYVGQVLILLYFGIICLLIIKTLKIKRPEEAIKPSEIDIKSDTDENLNIFRSNSDPSLEKFIAQDIVIIERQRSLSLEDAPPNDELDIVIIEPIHLIHGVALKSINSSILSVAQANSILPALPIIIQNDTWILLYSVLQHGADISSFYFKTKAYRHTLIVVEAQDGSKFGGFTSCAWRRQNTHGFYGSGESFLFRLGIHVISRNVLCPPTYLIAVNKECVISCLLSLMLCYHR
jgi:hypothetical protein